VVKARTPDPTSTTLWSPSVSGRQMAPIPDPLVRAPSTQAPVPPCARASRCCAVLPAGFASPTGRSQSTPRGGLVPRASMTRVKVPADAAPRPVSAYTCTKSSGEALGRFDADTSGLGVVCLRFGAVTVADPALADDLRTRGAAQRISPVWLSRHQVDSPIRDRHCCLAAGDERLRSGCSVWLEPDRDARANCMSYSRLRRMSAAPCPNSLIRATTALCACSRRSSGSWDESSARAGCWIARPRRRMAARR